MLYIIIGGIILFLIFARFGTEGIGCFLFLILAFVLWRIGLLPFLIRMLGSILRWIVQRIVILYYKIFGEEEGTTYFIQFIQQIGEVVT